MKQSKSWLILLVLLSLLAASCAPVQQGAAEEGAAATAEKATVEFWFNPPDGGEGANCMVETAIDTFNAQSQTVFVNAVANPDTWNATRTALAGGAGPDIVGTPGPSFVYELAAAGQLLPLDDFVDSLGWDENIAPWALSLGKVDGKLYSLPDELETLVLYYNKTLFEANGWTPPTTVEEMTALAEKIQAAGIIPFAHSNSEWRAANEWFVGEFLNHVAGPDKVYQALSGKLRWDDPDFVLAMEVLNDYQQKGYFMGGLELYYTTTFDEAMTTFGKGEAAMNIEGTWRAQQLIDVHFVAENGGNEWDWVPMPSTSGEAIFDIGIGNTWSINKNAANPEAAAEFLTYLYQPQTQAALIQKCGRAPAPVKLEANALDSIDPRIAAILTALSEANAEGNYGYTTWTFWPPKSDAYIYEEVEKVWAGEMTAAEYLAGLQTLFEEELAEGAIPPLPER
ncbi:MAG: extracellular solute-binding protein [Caldilinea sp. CFX5]|nr:extracellular solute-binding protein [Caldilinea sp. CFX5]